MLLLLSFRYSVSFLEWKIRSVSSAITTWNSVNLTLETSTCRFVLLVVEIFCILREGENNRVRESI